MTDKRPTKTTDDRYRILKADNPDDLARAVNAYFGYDADDWQPLGGVAISNYRTTDCDGNSIIRSEYMQAMVRP